MVTFLGVLLGPAPGRAVANTDLGCPGGALVGDTRIATALSSQLTGKMHGYLRAAHIACARVIARTVRSEGFAVRAAAIAITSTIVESTISNIDYGLGTSVGLYQQIDAWGSVAARTDPVKATRAFLTTMRTRYPDGSWATRPIGEVCQAVQRSAYPDRYEPEGPDGIRLANALWDPVRPLLLHDFSGDGVADLIAISATGELRYYPDNVNTHSGIPFGSYLVTGQGWDLMSRVVVGDFSGDGVADLVATTVTGEMRYYPNNMRATGVPFTTYLVTGAGWDAMSRILVGDFSGDGVADLVATTGTGEMRYYPNNMRATGRPAVSYMVTGQGWQLMSRVVVGDFSGDGVAELVGTTIGGELRYYPNNMKATAIPFVSYWGTGQGWNAISRILVGDFSGDGAADLLGTTAAGDLWYYPNNMRTTGVPFTTHVATGQGWNTISRALVGDFSGDGVAELVATTTAGELRYYPNNMRATGVPFSTYVVTGQGWNAINTLP